MIKTRVELKSTLKFEKKLYWEKYSRLEDYITSNNRIKIYRFLCLLRKTEYHRNNDGLIHKALYVFYKRRKNVLGRKLGIEMGHNCFDAGLLIYHAGNIVVNGNAKIGKNCKLHGSNCIGNNGFDNVCPIIGNNVRLGVGAKVIGNVRIANNITIAAGAIVVDSFEEEGITIGGVPARKIK